MNQRKLTKHACDRARQRAIPPLIIDWLLHFGDRESSAGAVRLSFSKRSRREIAGEYGHPIVSQLSRFLNACAIVDGSTDQVITVMWQDRR